MQGITSSLKIALSGLQLAQHGLSNASNNVSNVNTTGYTRKSIEQEARVIAGSGAGVIETAVSREVDSFLELQLREMQGSLGRSEAIEAYLNDLQGLVFGDPTDEATGLAHFVDTLTTKLESLASNPDNAASRANVVWAAKDLFQQVSRGADMIQTLRRDADQRINNLIEEVNIAVQAIHEINLDLKRQNDSPDLLDQRDRLIEELSYKLNIKTYVQSNGSVAIHTEQGHGLLEAEPRVLAYQPAATMTRNASFAPLRVFEKSEIDPVSGAPIDWSKGKILVGSGVRAELPAEFAATPGMEPIDPTMHGGEIGGLLSVRDKHLPDLDDQLVEFGRLLSHALNGAHNDANALPLPSSLEGSRLREDITGPSVTGMSGKAYLQVTAGTTTVYEIDLDDPGVTTAVDIAAQINAFDPDLTATLNVGEGLKIDWTGAPPPGGVSFAIVNEGAGEAPATITQTDAAGHTWEYGLAHFFGLNDMVVTSAGDAADLAIRADIDADPSLLATAKLDVIDNAGVPEGSLGSVGDNRGFLELAAAMDRSFATVPRGGLASANISAREYIGDVLNIQALIASNVTKTAATDRALADELTFQKAAISGVNLDEEMAYLLQLQQAYAASAKVLSTADEMLEILLNIKR